MSSTEPSHILFISSYPPRECGIATFTQDLTGAFDKKFNPLVKTEICALNEQATSIYNYNGNVMHQIAATELENYVSFAQKINARNDIKLVNIQHEFGIFGGRWGDYLIPFLQALEKPVVITFHSVIPKPSHYLKKIVKLISAESQAIVVMNKFSQKILTKYYNVPQYKISYIPHGIPQVIYGSGKNYKKQLGLENKIILSTFGLISKNKGIEYAIRALPKVIKKFPNLVYLVIGETHPSVRKKEGEKYRNFLNKQVKKLGLKNNVKFYNKYISLEEIIRFLQATDLYISTSIDSSQSVSGTLSYALGCGRPAISTPTDYAKHIINERNGILVPFRNSYDVSKAILSLLSNEKMMRKMGACAYKDTRSMIWPNVAESYFKLYKKIAEIETEENKLPEIKFDHIIRLTDNFGVIQHARYSKPEKRFGYSSDDIARALIISGMHYKNNPSPQLEKLMNIYINFIKFAQRKDGSFVNIISYRKEKDKTCEEDVQGRTIWALGYIASQNYLPKKIKIEALKSFKKTLPCLKKIKAPRSIAFAMIGLYFYLKSFPQDIKLKKIFEKLADHLVELYKQNASYEWPWFENFLTYSNSKLPEALFYAYSLLRKTSYLKVAQSSLNFLDSITFGPKYYAPIGQKGWYFRDKNRSYFDQQPEDVSSMVQTKIIAYKVTKNKKHLDDALKAFQWFLGKNYLSLMVYDELTGGCHDGLGQYELNLNQGAESSICYLMARLSFEDLK
ncbi:MAG: glycosyltransferase family 4 protein [bacterium]|nr:glycosyltransferase family 4 protein [bacterium]